MNSSKINFFYFIPMKDNILILSRHGERIDRSNETQRSNKYDPELTKKGVSLSQNIGIQIANEFRSYINLNGIKLYSSPFTRALETVLSMRNEFSKIIPEKSEQELTIIKDLGEFNQKKEFPFDVYPTLLYYLNGKNEKETKLYDELIKNKMNENVKYNLKYVDYGKVKYPESQKYADKRYVYVLQKILKEFENKENTIINITAHGEVLYAMNKYLLGLIKQSAIKNGLNENDVKATWPDFLNSLNGNNQKYCNSLCYRVSPDGDVSYYGTIIPTNL